MNFNYVLLQDKLRCHHFHLLGCLDTSTSGNSLGCPSFKPKTRHPLKHLCDANPSSRKPKPPDYPVYCGLNNVQQTLKQRGGHQMQGSDILYYIVCVKWCVYYLLWINSDEHGLMQWLCLPPRHVTFRHKPVTPRIKGRIWLCLCSWPLTKCLSCPLDPPHMPWIPSSSLREGGERGSLEVEKPEVNMCGWQLMWFHSFCSSRVVCVARSSLGF